MQQLPKGASPLDMAKKHAERFARDFAKPRGKIAFIEAKKPDLELVNTLLAHCERCNQWANRGPLYWALAESYEAHMNLPSDVAVTPCANGGIALEVLGRLHEIKIGRPLRWAGSAFSFANLGRGYFAGMRFVDCGPAGMLDLHELRSLDPESFDGVVVTNIFGLWKDFAPYIRFAQDSGKALLIDNAAGIDERVADWPYQAFSLHHTKPYGAGEGGFMLSPRDEAEAAYALIDYGEIGGGSRERWFNNGKLSDIACAFHLDRLARYPDWAPRYREQAGRVARIAAQAGLTPLVPHHDGPPATSRPFLAPEPVPLTRLQASERLRFGRYYRPLSEAPTTRRLYDRLVNIPTHPDVARLTDAELADEFTRHCLSAR